MRMQLKERISGWFNDWLGTIVSVLALMALVRHGFNYGFSPTLQLMLDAYESATRFFLEWTEPYIKELIAGLRKFVGWDLTLYPHWKHIFLLMMLYFGARLKAAWAVGEYAAATYLLIVGFSLALSASIGAGAVPLQPGTNQRAISLLVAIFPIAGVLMFDTMEIIWSSTFRREQLVKTFGDPTLTRIGIFAKLARKVLARFVFAAAVIFGWTQAGRLPVLHELPSPGLIVLGFLIVATAIYWLYQGLEATRTVRRSAERDVTDRQPSEKFVDAWWRRGSTRVGWLILRSVGVLLVVVAISAGEKLLGR